MKLIILCFLIVIASTFTRVLKNKKNKADKTFDVSKAINKIFSDCDKLAAPTDAIKYLNGDEKVYTGKVDCKTAAIIGTKESMDKSADFVVTSKQYPAYNQVDYAKEILTSTRTTLSTIHCNDAKLNFHIEVIIRLCGFSAYNLKDDNLCKAAVTCKD